MQRLIANRDLVENLPDSLEDPSNCHFLIHTPGAAPPAGIHLNKRRGWIRRILAHRHGNQFAVTHRKPTADAAHKAAALNVNFIVRYALCSPECFGVGQLGTNACEHHSILNNGQGIEQCLPGNNDADSNGDHAEQAQGLSQS